MNTKQKLKSLAIGLAGTLCLSLGTNYLNSANFVANASVSTNVQQYRNGTTYTGKAISLKFDSKKYKLTTVKLNGKSIKVREYTNIVYVSKPVSKTYEKMNIYIPDAYFHNKKVNGYTKDTAPIFLPNNIGAYMSGTPISLTGNNMPKLGNLNNGNNNSQMQNNNQSNTGSTSSTSTNNMSKNASKNHLNQNGGAGSTTAIKTALLKGFVVASPGARGRDAKENGKNIGSAPAAIVDMKAAVRYLKYNNSSMPGNANRIIADGTSAGGAISALLASTGNNKDYTPYLKAIGAANTSDNIYADYAFAPITNLDNADMAYEWEFSGINKIDGSNMMGSTPSNTPLTANQIKMSQELKKNFSSYINNLGLTYNGKKLTLNQDGTGSFADYIEKQIIKSANTAIAQGTKISTKKYPWLTMKDGKVTKVNLTKYFASIGRSKAPTAFDAIDLSSGETQLFSTTTKNAQHFTTFGMENNTQSGATKANTKVVKMMNPMNYIGKSGTTLAKHYWIRYGEIDPNTSVAIPSILAQKLKNAGADVNYHVQWNTAHTGDYDMNNMFKWAEKITK